MDSMTNQKIFEIVKRRKLKSALDPDSREDVENVSMQSTTHERENNSESDCESSSFGREVTPQEFAFSIDDVFEQILSSLGRTSVFTCRLVSRRWRLFSTRVISQRRDVCINFKYSPTDQVYVKQRTNADEDAGPKLTLEDLNRFLTENYGPTGPFKIGEFPCEVFEIVDGSLSDPQLQSFLTAFGEYISLLYLDFTDSPEGECETTLIKQIGHLLNTQAPHLQFLCFGSSSTFGVPETDDSHHPVVSFTYSGLAPQFQNDKGQEAKETNRKERIGLLELEYLGGQRKLFDYIISISPKLHDIIMNGHNLHLLSSHLNRLNLLKYFQYFIRGDAIFDIKNLKSIEAALCVSNEERESQKLSPIKFTRLSIDFENIVGPMLTNPDIQSSFVRVINNILELSWDTLESISLVNLDDIRLKKIKWTRVLPNVRHLELRLGQAFGSGLELFPGSRNLKIQETFPQLKTLTFDEVIEYEDDVSITDPGEFLRNCNFGPALSVQFVNVIVFRYLSDLSVLKDVDVTEDVERFRSDVTNSLVRLFPSAELTIKEDVLN